MGVDSSPFIVDSKSFITLKDMMNIWTHEIDVYNNLVFKEVPILSGVFMMVYAGRYNSGLGFIKVQSDLMLACNGLNML